MTAADRAIKVLDRALALVQNPREDARKFLFEHFEPFFFELTALNRDYLAVFDEVIAEMERPAPRANKLGSYRHVLQPAQEKVRVLSRTLAQVKPSAGGGRDPFTDLLRKINWYIHLGVGGIAEARMLSKGASSLCDLLGDWPKTDDPRPLVEEARRLRRNLVSQWATLCTSYTQVKLACLKPVAPPS
jgi:hypothetical protein